MPPHYAINKSSINEAEMTHPFLRDLVSVCVNVLHEPNVSYSCRLNPLTLEVKPSKIK